MPADPHPVRDTHLLLRAPLTFQAGGEKLHCPMVAVEIAGTPTQLIVDTGATHHVLTMELADEAGLAYEPGEPGTDIAGAKIPSYSVGEVTLTFAGSPIGLSEVVAIDGPEPFASWGIGGFLSPQRLWPGGTLVLDLVSGALSILEGPAEEVRQSVLRKLSGLSMVEGARYTSGMLGVTAAVLPFAPVVAALDSGAATTDVASAAIGGGLPSVSADESRGVSGNVITSCPLADQALDLGVVRVGVPSLSVRDHIPPPQEGKPEERPLIMIGMDVLRGTALVIAPASSGDVWWFVAGDGGN